MLCMAPREGRECSAEKLVLAIACGFRVDRGLKRIELVRPSAPLRRLRRNDRARPAGGRPVRFFLFLNIRVRQRDRTVEPMTHVASLRTEQAAILGDERAGRSGFIEFYGVKYRPRRVGIVCAVTTSCRKSSSV